MEPKKQMIWPKILLATALAATISSQVTGCKKSPAKAAVSAQPSSSEHAVSSDTSSTESAVSGDMSSMPDAASTPDTAVASSVSQSAKTSSKSTATNSTAAANNTTTANNNAANNTVAANTTANGTPAAPASSAAPVSSAPAVVSTVQRTYKADGIYTASGDKGYRDVVTVSVTITNDRIASVTIDSYQDDEAYVSQVKKYVLQRFVNQQSANVTGVSGATYSSNAVKSAVANALAKAKA